METDSSPDKKFEELFENCDKDEKELLHFMKNLAIIMEGRDQCAAIGYEESSEKIFITRNHFFHKLTSDNIHNTKEDKLIKDVIADLKDKNNNIQDLSNCDSILEILIRNLEDHDFCLKSETRSAGGRDRIKKYLHNYLNGNRVTKETRNSLRISNLFGDYKIQNRIKRFSSALRGLINSKYLSKTKNQGSMQFETLYNSSKDKVHAELRLVNYFLDIYLNKTHNSAKANEGNNNFQIQMTQSRKFFVIPSRLPCQDCKCIIKNVNKIMRNKLHFISPINNNYEAKYKNCVYPDFLKLKEFEHILKEISKNDDMIKTECKVKATNKDDERKEGLLESNKTDNNIDKIFESPYFPFIGDFNPDSDNVSINEMIISNAHEIFKNLCKRNLTITEADLLDEVEKTLFDNGYGYGKASK